MAVPPFSPSPVGRSEKTFVARFLGTEAEREEEVPPVVEAGVSREQEVRADRSGVAQKTGRAAARKARGSVARQSDGYRITGGARHPLESIRLDRRSIEVDDAADGAHSFRFSPATDVRPPGEYGG